MSKARVCLTIVFFNMVITRCVCVQLHKSAIISVVEAYLHYASTGVVPWQSLPHSRATKCTRRNPSMTIPVSAVHVIMKCHDAVIRYTSLPCFTYPRDICAACWQVHWLSARGACLAVQPKWYVQGFDEAVVDCRKNCSVAWESGTPWLIWRTPIPFWSGLIHQPLLPRAQTTPRQRYFCTPFPETVTGNNIACCVAFRVNTVVILILSVVV